MWAWHIKGKQKRLVWLEDGLRQGGVRDETGEQQGLSQRQTLKSKAQRNNYMVLSHWKHTEFLKFSYSL